MRKSNRIRERKVRKESPRKKQERRRKLLMEILVATGWGLAFGMFVLIWSTSAMHEKQMEAEDAYFQKYYEEEGPQVEVGDGYSIPYKDYDKFCQDREKALQEDAWNE